MRFKAKWTHSLAFRILLAYIAGALLSIGLLVVLGWAAQERLPGMDMTDRTQNLARSLLFDTSGKPVGFAETTEHPAWIYQSIGQETAYRVLDESGMIVLSSSGAEVWPHAGDIARLASGRFDIQANGRDFEGATERIEHNGKVWFVQLTASERLINFLHQEFAVPFIRLGVISLGLILLLIFGVCAFLSLRFSLKPLRVASHAASQISPKSLNARLSVDQVPLEIAPLINSFNTALARIEQGFRIQQDFLAQAAHELKTPLTLIRAEVELMECPDEFRKPLLAYVNHLTRHVQQLLLLAEASEPLSYEFEDIDIQNIVNDTAEYLETLANEAGVRLDTQNRTNNTIWHADRGAIFTLLKNLIENSIQHAPSGSAISIVIDSDRVCIRDRGSGVPDNQIPFLFSRFWRGTHRRDTGAGLGLAICQEICEAHGWRISAENVDPGMLMIVERSP
ncbi:two-component sensor histidine kinase [Pectobacterium aroidearum]|uniref:histidine kinase n=2 Tax=Pectobacteriaceae TaxID=1903410 RepID=A0ABR5ZAF2_9GAMM|nr:two-component sensor histidine kinase [Pectobacterium aroidearum]MBA5226800.1 two-component sensor histidine kinase [Pectobacterium aroidearum]MBA5231488.1 two-component sensor histidine kinase [Pectobacterium aroidearum]MBA5736634.1 two-component sensor histidine kinase [Pectobacterium aroidearum]GKV93321.1 histidine kinase [Pectobacterium carotovorum subsp. carotovorum]